MHRVILGLPEFPDKDIDFQEEFEHDFGIEVEATDYLDGATIYDGRAAGTVSTVEKHIAIIDGGIEVDEEDSEKAVVTDYYADFETGWVGVDSSDGEFLFEWFLAEHGYPVYRAYIDLDAWARELSEETGSSVWQVGWSHEDDDAGDDVGTKFHRGASFDEALKGDLNQLGFVHKWDGDFIRGTAAKSGYVAVFSTLSTPAFGRWLRDTVLPHAQFVDPADVEESQETLGEQGESGEETANV